MGNSPSHQAGGQEAGQKCADNQAGSSTNRVHGGTRKTRITVHGVPVDISEDCVCVWGGGLLCQVWPSGRCHCCYKQVQHCHCNVFLTCQSFGEVPNILMCRNKRMLVVLEGHRPYCWLYGASGTCQKHDSQTSRPPNDDNGENSNSSGGVSRDNESSSWEGPWRWLKRGIKRVKDNKHAFLPKEGWKSDIHHHHHRWGPRRCRRNSSNNNRRCGNKKNPKRSSTQNRSSKQKHLPKKQ